MKKTEKEAEKMNKKPKRQRKKKRVVTPSSSEHEDEEVSIKELVQDSDDDSETFSDFEELEKGNDSTPPGLNDDIEIGVDAGDSVQNSEGTENYTFKKHEWVVVKYHIQEQRVERKWIGKILEINTDVNTFLITFLRPKRTKQYSGYIYQYPEVKDEDAVSREQILYVLPPPEDYQRCLKFTKHCDNL